MKRQRQKSPGPPLATAEAEAASRTDARFRPRRIVRRVSLSFTVLLSSGAAVVGHPDPQRSPPSVLPSNSVSYRWRRPLPEGMGGGFDFRLSATRGHHGSLLEEVVLCGNNPGRPSHSAWLRFDSSAPTEGPTAVQTLRRPAPNDPAMGSAQDFASSEGRHGIDLVDDVSDDAPPSVFQAQRGEEGGDGGSSTESSAQHAEPHRTPLLYRYYGKSRSRTPGSGSIPFVLLGPNVDHFKLIGQELASRGFSVLACERVAGHGDGSRGGGSGSGGSKPSTPSEPEAAGVTDTAEDGAIVIGELLDALKWNRVVLVGCDAEAAATVQSAVQLAPSGRVAGLVLCGDLTSVRDMILVRDWDVTMNGIRSTNKLLIDNFVIDLFLQDRLQCPFTIVWSGDSPTLPVAQTLSPAEMEAFEALSNNRYAILGGGAAPHRRRPELFAWVLTRFVEEKIAGVPSPAGHRPGKPLLSKRGGQQDDAGADEPSTDPARAPPEPRPLNRLVRLQEFVSPGSFLVTGRMIATMIFYWSVMKVGIHQFDNICTGMVNVQSAVKHVDSWRAATFRFVGRILSKVGGLFLITSYTSSSTKNAASKADDTSPPGLDQGLPLGSDLDETAPESEASTTPESGDSPSIDDGTEESPGPVDDDKSAPQTDNSETDVESRPEAENERKPHYFFLDHVVA